MTHGGRGGVPDPRALWHLAVTLAWWLGWAYCTFNAYLAADSGDYPLFAVWAGAAFICVGLICGPTLTRRTR